MALVLKSLPAGAGDTEMRVRSLGWDDPLEESVQLPVFLPGESQGQRRLVGYSPGGRKVSDMTEVSEH